MHPLSHDVWQRAQFPTKSKKGCRKCRDVWHPYVSLSGLTPFAGRLAILLGSALLVRRRRTFTSCRRSLTSWRRAFASRRCSLAL